MSNEPIVHKEPVVQSNPFAKHLAEHVNAGAVAIESERAIAEAQGKLVIAKRFPRDQARAYAAIIDACKRPGLAEEACYSFPRGGQTVSGPSIRLAEMLAANWGNIDYGIRELSRKEGVSEMEAYCWDLETNTMSSQKFTVRHIRDTRGGGVKLTDERDIYELTANMGGRRLRARILAIIPADLVQAAVDECSKTMAGGTELPLADRVRNMLTAFKTLGIQPALIEKRLGHALDVITGEELGDLRKIHNSIRDGISKINDWFGDRQAGDDESMPGDPVVRPAPPPRAKKGASAVKESASEATPAPVAPEPYVDTQPAKPIESFADAAKATESKPTEPPSTVTAVPGNPRAFLSDGETIQAIVKINTVEAKQAGEGAGVIATVSGDYNGEVRHKTGGVMKDGKPEPLPVWMAGKTVALKLTGKKVTSGPQSGKVIAVVESVVEAGPASPGQDDVEQF